MVCALDLIYWLWGLLFLLYSSAFQRCWLFFLGGQSLELLVFLSLLNVGCISQSFSLINIIFARKRRKKYITNNIKFFSHKIFENENREYWLTIDLEQEDKMLLFSLLPKIYHDMEKMVKTCHISPFYKETKQWLSPLLVSPCTK